MDHARRPRRARKAGGMSDVHWFPFVQLDGHEEFPLPSFVTREGASRAELVEIAKAHARRFVPSGMARLTKRRKGKGNEHC